MSHTLKKIGNRKVFRFVSEDETDKLIVEEPTNENFKGVVFWAVCDDAEEVEYTMVYIDNKQALIDLKSVIEEAINKL